MARLASGRTVLVRVTFPQESGPPVSLQITRLGASAKSLTTNAVWAAPADPTFPGRGFYALVDGSDLAQNEHVTATVPVGAPRAGVLVPAKALVYATAKPGSMSRPRLTRSCAPASIPATPRAKAISSPPVAASMPVSRWW